VPKHVVWLTLPSHHVNAVQVKHVNDGEICMAMGSHRQTLRYLTIVEVVSLLAVVVPAATGQTITGTTASGLYYEVSGSGEPIVFIHAFSVDRRMWAPQVAEFENRYRVIRYDLRGHGKSIPPTEPYTGYDDLRGLLDTLGISKATLVGLSAGSELALNFAIAYPDRVARLIVAAPGLGGYVLPPLPWFGPVFEAAAAGKPDSAAKLWAATPIMALHTNVEEAKTVTSLVMDNTKLWTYRRTERPLDPPAIGRLAEITCPVLVIIGDQDLPHIRSIGDLLAEQVANAKLITIPGAGHIVNLDAPDQFNQALAVFLENRE
jgi:pimeloyl-ACP methyl ester carboxylesterase